MPDPDAPDIIKDAIARVTELSSHPTDGTWLEELTATAGPHIREWDLAQAYQWGDWPDRDQHFPRTTNQDVGIDVVAVRRSDGEYIAMAMGWDAEHLAHLRQLPHQEPHVRGLGYNQYGDKVEE